MKKCRCCGIDFIGAEGIQDSEGLWFCSEKCKNKWTASLIDGVLENKYKEAGIKNEKE